MLPPGREKPSSLRFLYLFRLLLLSAHPVSRSFLCKTRFMDSIPCGPASLFPLPSDCIGFFPPFGVRTRLQRFNRILPGLELSPFRPRRWVFGCGLFLYPLAPKGISLTRICDLLDPFVAPPVSPILRHSPDGLQYIIPVLETIQTVLAPAGRR